MVAAAGQLPTAPLYTTRWDTTALVAVKCRSEGFDRLPKTRGVEITEEVQAARARAAARVQRSRAAAARVCALHVGIAGRRGYSLFAGKKANGNPLGTAVGDEK
jgi:hypothetical protein